MDGYRDLVLPFGRPRGVSGIVGRVERTKHEIAPSRRGSWMGKWGEIIIGLDNVSSYP